MKPNLRGTGIHIVYGQSRKQEKAALSTWNILSVTALQTRELYVYKQKTPAVEIGRMTAKLKKVELYVHGRDGKIKSRDSYGKESKKKDKR